MAYRKKWQDLEFDPVAGAVRRPPENMAEVNATVRADSTLSPSTCRDIRSALATVARITARGLASISANNKAVRELLDGVAPALHGISRARWRNVRSLVFKSLAVAGVRRLSGRSSTPPSARWRRSVGPLPYRPYRVALSPFARYCTERGIEPRDVGQADFERYAVELEEFGMRSRPRATYVELCRAWNQAGNLSPDWPNFHVELDDRRPKYAKPWSAYPASLKVDIDAMVEAALSPDLTKPTSRKPVKPVTTEARVRLLGTLLAAQCEGGVDPSSLTSLTDIVGLENARIGLRGLIDRAGGKSTVYVHQHAKLICTLAKHWVGVPDDQLDQLVAIRNNLNPGRHGMTPKNKNTLRHFEDNNLVAKFLGLPERVTNEVMDRAILNQAAAVQVQIALAIELLTVAPARCKNLVATRIGANIIDTGSGRSRRMHLYYSPDEVKNEVELEFPLPVSTVKLLDGYIRHVRPRLLRSPSDYLFPGAGAGPKGGALLSEQIANLVESEIGVRLTAHQFRHLAGFIYLQHNPGGHEIVRRLLGHKSIDTTIRFYAGMEIKQAIKHYDDLIAKRRASLDGSHLPRQQRGKKK